MKRIKASNIISACIYLPVCMNLMATGGTPVVLFLARIFFFFFTIVRISFGAHLVCCPVDTGSWHENMAPHLHLVLAFRMCGTLPPCPHTMVCCLTTGGSFALILLICKYIYASIHTIFSVCLTALSSVLKEIMCKDTMNLQS